MDDATLGTNLRRIRESAGLSQAELAAKAADAGWEGVYPQTILKVEKGTRSLKASELPALAVALDIPVGRLAGELLAARVDIGEAAAADFERSVAPLLRRQDRAQRDLRAANATVAERTKALRQLEDSVLVALAEWGGRHREEGAGLLDAIKSARKLTSVKIEDLLAGEPEASTPRTSSHG